MGGETQGCRRSAPPESQYQDQALSGLSDFPITLGGVKGCFSHLWEEVINANAVNTLQND